MNRRYKCTEAYGHLRTSGGGGGGGGDFLARKNYAMPEWVELKLVANADVYHFPI